jgi:ABC-2 type transport system permease protein
VIEILLSSVKPEQLLAGKIIGLCGAGLTQIAAWLTIVVVPALYFLPFLNLRWDQLFVALIFFPLGYLVFGSLMGGTASLGNNMRESQQASMIWTFSAILPLMLFPAIIAQPNGTLARVLSYIPLTAPGTIMLRIGATRVPLWDIALSAAILIASLFLIIRLSAKLFRMGTLMYGKKPSVVEIVRWLRAA